VKLFKKKNINNKSNKNISLSEIAWRYHSGQKRRSGEPYIIHPERVLQIIKSYYPKNKMAKMIAILHDCLEECCSNDKSSIFYLIRKSLNNEKESEELIESMLLLTKENNISYEDHVMILTNYENLVIVKTADILDNLRDNPSDNQKLKYKKAINVIIKKFCGKPKYIHPNHWDLILEIIK
jgi:(p)ppGpp synthase/HD superfamily hydrolase